MSVCCRGLGVPNKLAVESLFYLSVCVCVCLVCFRQACEDQEKNSHGGPRKCWVKVAVLVTPPWPLIFDLCTEPWEPSEPLSSWLHLQRATPPPPQSSEYIQGNQRPPTSNSLLHDWTKPSLALQSGCKSLTRNSSLSLFLSPTFHLSPDLPSHLTPAFLPPFCIILLSLHYTPLRNSLHFWKFVLETNENTKQVNRLALKMLAGGASYASHFPWLLVLTLSWASHHLAPVPQTWSIGFLI